MSLPTNSQTTPFAVLTDNLLLIPTPLAIISPSYLSLYASLHADAAFCKMAFGHHFPPRNWSVAETREVVQTRDIERCWNHRGLGDFAVARRKDSKGQGSSKSSGISVVSQDETEKMISSGGGDGGLDACEWVGYAGVRDATTSSMPDRTPTDPPLPHYLEMVELRYGVASAYWGKGLAREAAEAVMEWAVKERGVRRFIAETEIENVRSGRVLEKMGFSMLSGTPYWAEESEHEWERVVV